MPRSLVAGAARALMLFLLFAALAACRHAPIDSGLPGLAPAAPAPKVPGYLTAPDGTPAQNAQGQCWRTADWRPILATEQCDPAQARRNREVEARLATALAAVAPAAAAATPPGQDANASADPGAAPAATPAATAPVPAAAPTVAGLDMVTKPVTLSSDAAFFFGKDTLTPAGRDAVENLAAYIKLWGIEGVRVEITGHTDRIGNDRDNLALSKRRADAVGRVLVEAGVAPGAISARGVGSSQPLTTLADCPADLVRCELIACLAPDRRVDIQLKGTRKAPAR